LCAKAFAKTILPVDPNRLRDRLGVVLPVGRVVIGRTGTGVYDTDAFTLVRGQADAVVFPESTAEAAAAIRLLRGLNATIITRGSGTGLAGGAVPLNRSARMRLNWREDTNSPPADPSESPGPTVVISTSRMTRIFEIDPRGRWAHVEAGVLNGTLNDALASARVSIGGGSGPSLHFAPDPSSARASTIGGNAATNAGGVHTLKDFVTSNHVYGVTVVTPSGEVLTTGGRHGATTQGPFDLTALYCGSEGTLGLVTELFVRLTPKREGWRTLLALFDNTRAACDAVSRVIGAGVLPAAMEMLDGTMVRVIEDAYHFGIPEWTRSMVVLELDGEETLLDREADEVRSILNQSGAREIRSAETADERARLWKARKSAFGAIGKLSHSYCTQDACVPRSRLGDVLEMIQSVGARYGLTISNVFHAGDGNVHPIFLYDEKNPDEVRRAMSACAEVLEGALAAGGTITGEHGVGVEKVGLMARQFDGPTLDTFGRIRICFDPTHRWNPGKLLPDPESDFAVIRPG
jgi:glycolate oxidase